MSADPLVTSPVLAADATRVRHGVLAFLFVFSFLTIVDRVAISAAKSSMAAELGIGDVAFGLIFGVFALGYALGQVPSGWAVDRFGPRAFLAAIVVAWSLFTGLTALMVAVPMLIAVRLLFGLAEAGIYPTASRAIYSWIPPHDRGGAQGLLFIGSRLGAAFGLSVVSAAMAVFGWRGTFWALAVVGIVLAAAWYAWFRNTPDEKPGISRSELVYIRTGRISGTAAAYDGRSLWDGNAVLLAVQYFASNFTFFIAFTWLLPYLQSRYALSPAEAGAYASVPLYFGAFGNWLSGSLVDTIYRRGYRRQSRLVPAMAGFALGIVGLLAAPSMWTAAGAIVCFSLATLGVDMTLSPSWTSCQDLAGPRTGLLSGAMNMVGNLGSFVSSITFPVLLEATGSAGTYFYLAAALNLLAIGCWSRIHPHRA
jgi:ACS family glucarate transporter-like MFS transporter